MPRIEPPHLAPGQRVRDRRTGELFIVRHLEIRDGENGETAVIVGADSDDTPISYLPTDLVPATFDTSAERPDPDPETTPVAALAALADDLAREGESVAVYARRARVLAARFGNLVNDREVR